MGEPAVLISCLHYEWATLDEAFERCGGELGLDGIELSLHPSGRFPHIGPEHYEQTAELAAKHSLQLSAHIWDNLPQLGPDGGACRLLEWLDAARTMGIRTLVVHGGTHDDQAEGIRLVTRMLAEVAPAYEAAGVVLCLENHYAYHHHDRHELFSTPEEFLPLFEAVASPAVRLCLDYGHSHMTKNTDDLLARVGPYLAYTHLADNEGEEDDHLAFGCGTVPWRSALLATKRAGFRGPFTIEFPVRSATGGAFRQCIDLLGELFG